MKIQSIIPLLALLAVSGTVSGQTARLYSPDNGLPNTQVNQICQDRSGIVWICTEGGLVRFDGVDFETFQRDRENPNSISSDSVHDIVEDVNGTMWVATASGLNLFDADYNSFHRYELRDERRPENIPYIVKILEVPDRVSGSRLFVATGGYGIFVIDTRTRHLQEERRKLLLSHLPSDYIHSMFLDADRHLWVVSEGTTPTVILDVDTLAPAEGISIEPSLSARWDKVRITAIAEDPVSRNLLIGTSTDGLLVYESATRTLRRARGRSAARTVAASILFDTQSETPDTRSFLLGDENGGLLHFDTRTEETEPGSLPSIRQDVSRWKATAATVDNQGNIWLGLYQTGVLVAPKSMFGFNYIGFNEHNNPGENSACVMALYDDGRRLWAGTDGAGLFCREGQKTRNFTRTNSRLDNNAVMAVLGDRRGTLWVGTYAGGLYEIDAAGTIRPFPDPAGIGTERVRCLAYDADRDWLYVGTYGAGLAVVDARTKRVIHSVVNDDNRWVSALHIDAAGILWVGTYNGPKRFDPATRQLTAFDVLHENEPPRIYTIGSEPDGTLWFGTGEGVFRVSPDGTEIRQYSEKDGLANNVVRSILRANNGEIWISTASGLSRFSPETGRISSYHASDGLQGNEFRSGAACIAPSGRLYFGGTSGVTAINPAMMDGGVHKVPQVSLSRLSFLNREVEYNPQPEARNLIDKHISQATRINVPTGVDLFSLEFSAPEYTNPQRIMFDYRLRGYDSDWKTAPSRLRMATYTNVPPGNYHFEVRAYFEGAPEDYTARSVDLHVDAPWYRTGVATVFYLVLLAGIGLLLHNMFMQRRARKREQEDAELKELRLGLFTNLTHEIRTPLNLVMGPLGTLRVTEQDPSRKDTYNLMYRNCLRINRIVNQLMDLRKIDAGQMPMHFRETDVIYFIKDIMQSFSNLAQTRQIDFALEAPRKEELLWIDQGNFDKIIYNILSNAFKHTPEGGRIRIRVSAPVPNTGLLRPDIHKYVTIRIFNSGSQVEEAYLSRIFDRFVQVNPHDALSGSGVGLNLTKMLVELHHGKISAENEDGGVVFSVVIPEGNAHLTQEELSETPHHKDLYVKTTEAQPDGHEDQTYVAADNPEVRTVRAKKNIVVVEDDAETRDYLKSLLRDLYNVTACADAQEAWPVVAGQKPDVVVTDLVMPGMSGSEFCAKIRQTPETNHIPVIILTGENSEQEERVANDSGADKFLSKPISVDLLLSSISQVISAREAVKDKFGVTMNFDYSGIRMGSADEKLLRRIVESVSAHLDDPEFGVAMLCEDVGISRVHLNRKLKAFGKDSPGTLIKNFRMKQAAHLLVDNRVNVSEVAYRVGFASHSYFSSSFKEFFGMTPREFVARHNENPDDEMLKKLLE
jgi:signal transduction histidine kinase/ligand-binding sensor domain-containing protein/CheY-like chemotaxis protein/AraC-like DNA-binding protein